MHPKERDETIQKFRDAGGEAVEAFLAWLEQEGLFICTDDIGLTTHDHFVPIPPPHRAALSARFTKIDPSKLVTARTLVALADLRANRDPDLPESGVDIKAPAGAWSDE